MLYVQAKGVVNSNKCINIAIIYLIYTQPYG